MDDVTDVVFRQIISEAAAPDLAMTEFVNVDGLQSIGRERIIHKLFKRPNEDNLIAQIWGKTPTNYQKTAAELAGMGFAGVDINMGCPDKTIVKNGCCAAFIENRDLALECIAATKKGVDGRVPISVKTRVGYNEVDLSWIELLLKQNLDMLTIHGRTKKQMSKVPANWDLIGECRRMRDEIAPQTLIVGNGDVENKPQAQELANKYQLDGVMIGRGVFQDPYAFANESPWQNLDPSKKIAMYKKQVELFINTYKKRERNPQTLKRYAKIYISNFNNASEIRQKIMDCGEPSEMLEVLKTY